MPAENYFLPPGYQENAINFTRDEGNRIYWTQKMIRTSGLYQQGVYRWAAEIVKDRKLKTVLDVGCGPATKLNRFLSHIADVTGIDQQSAIDYCHETYDRGTYIVADIGNNPTPLGKQFDLVICSDVIEHVDDPRALLRYLKAHVAENGLLLISTPDRLKLRGIKCNLSPNRFHVREWAEGEFVTLLKSEKFDVMWTRNFPLVGWIPLNLLAPWFFFRQIIRGLSPFPNLSVLATVRK